MASIKLNDFQQSAIPWLYARSRGLIVAPTGIGKTIASLSLFYVLQRNNPDAKLLVLAKSKTFSNWRRDNFRKLSISSVEASSDLAIFYKDASFKSSIYLVSPTILKKLILDGSRDRKVAFQSLLNQTSLLVVDEVHQYTNYKAQMTKAAKAVLDYYSKLINADAAKHKLGFLTATPVHRDPTNLYQIFNLLVPGLLGSYYDFCDNYVVYQDRPTTVGSKQWTRSGTVTVGKKISFRQVMGYRNIDALYARLSPYLFNWDKSDWTITHTIKEYKMTPDEYIKYISIVKGEGLDKQYTIHLLSDTDKFEIYRDKSDLMYLDQIHTARVDSLRQNQSVYYNQKFYKVDRIVESSKEGGFALRVLRAIQKTGVAQDKYRQIIDILRGCLDTGCLIYCSYYTTVDFFYKEILKNFPGHRTVVITGETKDADKVVASLNPSDFVIITKALGESMSMYQRNLILVTPLTSPGANIQLLGRITRHDAPWRDINVYHFHCRESVDLYFSLRLAFMLQHVKNKGGMASFPTLAQLLPNQDVSRVNIQWLKDNVLWKPI